MLKNFLLFSIIFLLSNSSHADYEVYMKYCASKIEIEGALNRPLTIEEVTDKMNQRRRILIVAEKGIAGLNQVIDEAAEEYKDRDVFGGPGMIGRLVCMELSRMVHEVESRGCHDLINLTKYDGKKTIDTCREAFGLK